jgi:hypothetical protein
VVKVKLHSQRRIIEGEFEKGFASGKGTFIDNKIKGKFYEGIPEMPTL